MANPAKRRVGGSGTDSTETSGEGTSAAASVDEAPVEEARVDAATADDRTARAGDGPTKPAAKVQSKRVTPPKARAGQGAASRYTPPNPRAQKGPSPRWVPILMFALWGLGLLVIILNYMGVMPGAGDGGNGWYLVAGLASILGGIMVATQYR